MLLKEKIVLGLKIATDGRYRKFFLQRAFTDMDVRMRRAAAVAARLPAFDEHNPESHAKAASLENQGFVFVDGLIDPKWLAEMKAYFAAQVCSDPYRSHLGTFKGPDQVPAGTHVAFYSNEVVVRAPHALEIANNPKVLGIVAKALGAKPTISSMNTWWSVPAGDGTAQHAEKFHRDVDDWKFIKLFCYLTDVDEGAGPHIFVRTSHRLNRLGAIRRYSEEEVFAAFGADNVMRFIGPAGTSFLENTYGMHRGLPPTDKPRLVFQILYSLRPLIYGPKSPVITLRPDEISHGIDPYINRVYCRVR